jgi:di/tricarboxylate transporter
MIVVLGIVAVTIVLFITEPVSVEVTALLIMVLLIILEPWTKISVAEGVSGFSNPATLTVLAMLILSEGIRRTGLVQLMAEWVGKLAGNSERRQLAATIAMSGPVSGFINNTPVVALLVPVISDMAHKAKTSPSKLLIPLSYASMLGGMLTLIGTSTNLLASDLSRRWLGHGFSMFEFTQLGAIVLIVGALYLMLFAPRLLPERVQPRETFVENYEMSGYLTEVEVADDSPLIGQALSDSLLRSRLDFQVVRVRRDGELCQSDFKPLVVRAGDCYLIRASENVLTMLTREQGLEIAGSLTGGPARGDVDAKMVELVIPTNSTLEGQTLGELSLAEQYGFNVLALRRRGENILEALDEIALRAGDTLLVYGDDSVFERLAHHDDVILIDHTKVEPERRSKIPLAVAIIVAVVGLAALDIMPILVSSMAGAVLMMVFGVVRPTEVYDSVSWEVFFLLAGIIPLGIALEQTGTAEFLGTAIAATSTILPAIVVLWVFYIATGLITEVISNNASVVLMIPVAIGAAETMGANPFAFVLAVTFAASTAFLGPIGYQTNLFVYGPGGYRVADFLRIGAPLQILLSIVTVAGIDFFWGVV